MSLPENLPEKYRVVMGMMHAVQKCKNITGNCIENCKDFYAFIKSTSEINVKVKAVCVLGSKNDTGYIGCGHLVLLVNDTYIVDPSYEIFSLQDKRYYDTTDEIFSVLEKSKKIQYNKKEMIKIHARFVTYADKIMNGTLFLKYSISK